MLRVTGQATQNSSSPAEGGGGEGAEGSKDSLSLLITFTSETQVNHTRSQGRQSSNRERHSSSYKKSYIMAFYGLYDTHIFTFIVL
jgi:hypothetical protein